MSAESIYRLKHDMPAWRITCPSSYWAWLGDSCMTWDHSTIRYPESIILLCSDSWSIPHLSPIAYQWNSLTEKIKLHFQRILWNFMWWLYHRPVEIPRTMAIEGDHHCILCVIWFTRLGSSYGLCVWQLKHCQVCSWHAERPDPNCH